MATSITATPPPLAGGYYAHIHRRHWQNNLREEELGVFDSIDIEKARRTSTIFDERIKMWSVIYDSMDKIDKSNK